jgi:hypothetical protein
MIFWLIIGIFGIKINKGVMKTALEVFDEIKLLPLIEQIRLERMINELVLGYTLSFLGLSTQIDEAGSGDSFEQGSYQTSDLPSAYGGIWSGEKRDLKHIRAEAWKRER